MDHGASSYRRYLDGDEEGFTELVQQYRDGLILFLCQFVSDLYTAEELAEDCFVKLALKKPPYTGEVSFKTWLYTIGKRLAIDHLRKNGKNEALSIDEVSEPTERQWLEQTVLQKQDLLELHDSMRGLKAEYRQVLWLYYFASMPTKQIAKVMGKRIHTVETLLYRSRTALKKELERKGFVYENL